MHDLVRRAQVVVRKRAEFGVMVNSSVMLRWTERDVGQHCHYGVGLPGAEVAALTQQWWMIADATPEEMYWTQEMW